MCFCVRQFILGTFQVKEMSMRLQNMEQTEIKGNFEISVPEATPHSS